MGEFAKYVKALVLEPRYTEYREDAAEWANSELRRLIWLRISWATEFGKVSAHYPCSGAVGHRHSASCYDEISDRVLAEFYEQGVFKKLVGFMKEQGKEGTNAQIIQYLLGNQRRIDFRVAIWRVVKEWPLPLRKIHQGVSSGRDNQGYEQSSHLETISDPKEISQREVSVLNGLVERERRAQLPEHLEKLINCLTEEQKCVLRHCLQKGKVTLEVIADSLGITMYEARRLKKFKLPRIFEKFCRDHNLDTDEADCLLRALPEWIERSEHD